MTGIESLFELSNLLTHNDRWDVHSGFTQFLGDEILKMVKDEGVVGTTVSSVFSFELSWEVCDVELA